MEKKLEVDMFQDRQQAGLLLADQLCQKNLDNTTCVLALPRGGVPVAWEVANRLRCPLDILFVKKVGAPRQSEFALGAVSEEGEAHWNDTAIAQMGLERKDLYPLAQEKWRELKAQINRLREGRPSLDVNGRTVIVVDDGLATGETMAVALQLLKKKSPRRIIVAIPTGSISAVNLISPLCDEIVVLDSPHPFAAVGQWYEDFTQVTDAEVEHLLHQKSGHQKCEHQVGDHQENHGVRVPCEGEFFAGELSVPKKAKGLIIFAHGSGSSHQSPRNKKVATQLNRCGFGTLLFDLLTASEAKDRRLVFNIPLLVKRLVNATLWVQGQGLRLPIGYFGASTGAAAALGAAAQLPQVASVVCRGGRPDLAAEYLSDVRVPVLLIVGGLDTEVLRLNQKAQSRIANCKVSILPGVGHLFEEAGALEQVTLQAIQLFDDSLAQKSQKSTEFSGKNAQPA
ncbi:MAG: phosphoribosyl transferase [Bdellovibrio sp.]|nr:MAG: phosphoribosyl transferase [Bdellovibrio sp.]